MERLPLVYTGVCPEPGVRVKRPLRVCAALSCMIPNLFPEAFWLLVYMR